MRKLAVFMIAMMLFSGCTHYKSQYVSFRPPEAYQNHLEQSGVSLGGEAYATSDAAEKAFGFDIKGAGLLPVMLVMDNKSGKTLELMGGQTFLVDEAGNYWPLVTNKVAFDRLESSTQFASFFGKGAGKGAVLGAAAGTVLGAALGIVSGRSVAGSLGKGAALGAAGGAIIGGTQEGTSNDRENRISDDLRSKGLEGKPIPADSLSNGFIFFPGEAPSAKELRLQWREKETGQVQKLILPLNVRK
ncbi:glycine zipper family protein [Geomonas subterranea]|uniref:Glycine zipper family protein n=1 Tax=Geomonas subterranea TaxID=2847989 RepID=A0ABX8LHJ1_9BACT|nr:MULTISPECIES: glycine zipper family protein [Geomonas]QXE89814.1 glycine zipper family protein [Geomonas subterranea]QXM08067.1 glycine zipper family protein [Geomonas subterranea]